jgi:hypothetical protein
VFDFAQQERKGRERVDIPCRPAKRPTKNWQGRRHSPVVAAWKEGGRASERERERGEEKGGLPCGAPPRVGRPTRSPQTQQQMAGKVGMKAMWFSTRGREDFGGRRPGFSCPSAGGEGLR